MQPITGDTTQANVEKYGEVEDMAQAYRDGFAKEFCDGQTSPTPPRWPDDGMQLLYFYDEESARLVSDYLRGSLQDRFTAGEMPGGMAPSWVKIAGAVGEAAGRPVIRLSNSTPPDDMLARRDAISDPFETDPEGVLSKWIDQTNYTHPEDAKIISDWSGRGYRDIRPQFLPGGTLDERGQALIDALERAPQLEGVVYRGIAAPDLDIDARRAFFDGMKNSIGSEIVWDAPASASLDIRAAAEFAQGRSPVIFEVMANDVRYVDSFSSAYGDPSVPHPESEAIFPPGSRFIVEGVSLGQNGYWTKVDVRGWGYRGEEDHRVYIVRLRQV